MLMCENLRCGGSYFAGVDFVCRLTFARWHLRQFLTNFEVSFRMPNQTKRSVINLIVALVPECDKPCVFAKICCRNSFGMYGRILLVE